MTDIKILLMSNSVLDIFKIVSGVLRLVLISDIIQNLISILPDTCMNRELYNTFVV